MAELIYIIRIAVEVLDWLIIARVILSWVRHDRYHPVFRFIYEITEPILAPIRRVLPKGSMIDFSPFIAIIALQVFQWILVQILQGMM